MSIFSQFQRTASQMVKRWHPLLVSIALALFCARLASADISTTGDVNPDPNTTTSSDPLYVGQASAGSMQVDDGSVVDSGFSHVGYDATATGSVRISGNGSAWNSQGLSVGRSGVGELAITAGAILDTTGPSHVGQVSGSAGMATISGAGSRWNATPYVYVGSGGTGELTIEEGGALNGSLTIGYFSDSQGTVTVQGASANLIGPILRVGEMGRGELLIANGATVVTTLSSEIGKERGSPLHAAGVGTVTVTGTGSEWRNDENVAIGVYGKGELMISDGGVVSCEHGWIAVHGETFFENSEGTVTVTGSGSVWAMTERLTIAGNAASGGDGTLTIGPGGLVQVGNSTSIGPQGRVKLDGGTFSSPIISIFSASGDGFEWTAGKLHTERFGRSLLNPAGSLAPGEIIGSTTIDGSYTQESAATLEVEIGGSSAGEFDVLTVNGSATLGGTLDVKLVDLGDGLFAPAAGDTFQILIATGGIMNRFEQELLPALGDLEWRVNYGPTAVSLIVMLPGDFNGDFSVDAADYVVWRKTDGTQDKYNTWRTNFGRTAGDGLAASLAAQLSVPEPASILLIVAGWLLAGGKFWRTR